MRTGFAAMVGVASLGICAFGTDASATVYFADDFNGYTNGTAANLQAGTGLHTLAYGDLPGWTKNTSQGNIHAVDRGDGDFAIMLYDGNLMYYATPIAANTLNTSYTVSFEGAYGVYADATQRTGSGDSVTFLLNDSTHTIASFSYVPNTAAFTASSFSYTGIGTGSVYLAILNGNNGDGRFGGAIDNVVVADTGVALRSTAVPEPASMMLLGAGFLGAASLLRRKPTA